MTKPVHPNSIKNLIPHQIKKGQVLNPNGRPVGVRSYNTIYREALKKIAKVNRKLADDIETDLVVKAIIEANRGDYRFYKDVIDRAHGTAVQKTDITTGGEKIDAVSLAERVNAITSDIDDKPKTS